MANNAGLPSTPPQTDAKAGFTLVELLVVIGIIAVLIGILLPTLTKARKEGVRIRCQANMKQIGDQMLMYANNNRGWLFPPMAGVNVRASERWMTKVFKFDKIVPPAANPLDDDPKDYTPKILLCPADATDVVVEPGSSPFVKPGQLNMHTYVLSHNLGGEEGNKVTYSSRELGGLTPSDFILMGEKVSSAPDHYMGTRFGQPSDYKRVVEFNRHGKVGSNYLHLDMHVSTKTEYEAIKGIDPWNYSSIISTGSGENN